DDERTKLLLFWSQDREGRGQSIECNVLDIQLEVLDRPHGVLKAIEISVNNQDICFQPMPIHSHWIFTDLVIHDKMLPDEVNGMSMCWQIDGLCDSENILDIILADFPIVAGNRMIATIVG